MLTLSPGIVLENRQAPISGVAGRTGVEYAGAPTLTRRCDHVGALPNARRCERCKRNAHFMEAAGARPRRDTWTGQKDVLFAGKRENNRYSRTSNKPWVRMASTAAGMAPASNML